MTEDKEGHPIRVRDGHHQETKGGYFGDAAHESWEEPSSGIADLHRAETRWLRDGSIHTLHDLHRPALNWLRRGSIPQTTDIDQEEIVYTLDDLNAPGRRWLERGGFFNTYTIGDDSTLVDIALSENTTAPDVPPRESS